MTLMNRGTWRYRRDAFVSVTKRTTLREAIIMLIIYPAEIFIESTREALTRGGREIRENHESRGWVSQFLPFLKILQKDPLFIGIKISRVRKFLFTNYYRSSHGCSLLSIPPVEFLESLVKFPTKAGDKNPGELLWVNRFNVQSMQLVFSLVRGSSRGLFLHLILVPPSCLPNFFSCLFYTPLLFPWNSPSFSRPPRFLPRMQFPCIFAPFFTSHIFPSCHRLAGYSAGKAPRNAPTSSTPLNRVGSYERGGG